MTSFTLSSPRTFNDRRNAVQNPSFFRISDVEAEYFAAPVGGNTDRDDDGLGDNPVVDLRFAVGRIEERSRVIQGREGAVAELRHLGVKAGADPRDFGFRNPGIGAECFDLGLDLTGGDSVQIGFHHDGEQGLVDPSAAFQ